MIKQSQDKLLKVSFVAEYLNVNDSTVRKWIRQGLLDAILLPSSVKRPNYRIKLSSLQKLLSNKVKTTS